MQPEIMMNEVLSADLLQKMDAYWRAANYLSVGQIYLQDNPLLEQPLQLAHVKPRLLGHWGTTPGLNLLYVHLNRLIKANDQTPEIANQAAADALLALAAWSDSNSQGHGGISCSTTTPSASP